VGDVAKLDRAGWGGGVVGTGHGDASRLAPTGNGGLARPGWLGALELGFAAAAPGAATRLVHRAHRGPFVVQRPLLPEGPELCHVYLLHPPGGLVGGDELRLDLRVGADAQALVTTPAAGKAYRTLGPTSRLTQTLAVGTGGSLEWLPQELIVFDGAAIEIETRIELARHARFIGAETVCFGLPARGERFLRGTCRQRFEVWRGAEPLFIERGRFDGGAPVHAAPWGLAGAPVMALLVAAPAPAPETVAALRELASTLPAADLAACTVLGDGELLIARYRGGSAERARNFVQAGWQLLRPALLGRPAVAPRIWAT
jgi:urease accessory protein